MEGVEAILVKYHKKQWMMLRGGGSLEASGVEKYCWMHPDCFFLFLPKEERQRGQISLTSPAKAVFSGRDL